MYIIPPLSLKRNSDSFNRSEFSSGQPNKPVRPTVGRRAFLTGARLVGAGVVADRITQRLGIGLAHQSSRQASETPTAESQSRPSLIPTPEYRVEDNMALTPQEIADALFAMGLLHAVFQYTEDMVNPSRPTQALGEWVSKGTRTHDKTGDKSQIFTDVGVFEATHATHAIFGTPDGKRLRVKLRRQESAAS